MSTAFGFDWGNAKVKRVAETLPNFRGDRFRILEIETPRQLLEVTITPTGMIRTNLIKIPKRTR